MLNKVLLIGRLTRDPELRQTGNGGAVVNFGLAMNRTFKVGDERREETTFVDVSVFGKQAESVNEYCQKGKQVLVEGRLNLDQWESNEGEKRSRLTVVADRVQFMSGDRSTDGDNAPAAAASNSGASGGDDDLPF